MKGKIYWIILHWKNKADTAECLHSLFKYEPEIRVILVDNGSGDDLSNFEKDYANLNLLKNSTNLGFSGGNNVGLRHALDLGAEYVGLLNNDTHVSEPFTASLVKVLDNDPKTGAAAPLIYTWPGKEIWGAGGRVRFFGRAEQFHKPLEHKPYAVDYLSGCCVLFRADALAEVGLLDEDYFFYYEDVDLSYQLRQAGFKLFVVPFVSIYHKVSAASGGQFTPFSTYHLLRSNLLFVKKNLTGFRKMSGYFYLILLSKKIALNSIIYNLDKKIEVLFSLFRAWRDFLNHD